MDSTLIAGKDPSRLFVEIVRDCERLPIELRCRAHDALSIQETHFDESYLEFLDTARRLRPRDSGWAARMHQRRADLQPYCGFRLLHGIIPCGTGYFSVYVSPERRAVVHWEGYDSPYSTSIPLPIPAEPAPRSSS